MDRRQRLRPIKWGLLPSVSAYQSRLKELSRAADFGAHQSALEGLKDLVGKGSSWDDPAPPVSMLKLPSANGNGMSNGMSNGSMAATAAVMAAAAASVGEQSTLDSWEASTDTDTE